MSTVSDEGATSGRTAASSQVATSESLELAEAVATFAATFERWSRALMATDAPSLPRMRLLYTLHCQGPQRMGDLADALEVTPRSVTALVDGLETEGMVRRRPDPADRRATIIESTGSFDAEGGYLAHAGAVAAIFSELSPADRRDLLRLSRALIAGMRGTVKTNDRG